MSTSKEIKQKIKELRQDYVEAVKSEFKKASDKLFAEHSELKSFGWRQYTPYFNDGSELNFNVYADDPDINGIDGNDISYGNKYKDFQKIQTKVAKFLGSFDDEIFKDIFGDHTEVTVYPNKIDTDGYQHD